VHLVHIIGGSMIVHKFLYRFRNFIAINVGLSCQHCIASAKVSTDQTWRSLQ